MSEPDQNGSGNLPGRPGDQDLFHAPLPPPLHLPTAETKKPSRMLVPGLGGALMILILLLVVNQAHLQLSGSAGNSDDLGAGISNVSGLRGHLVTRWQQGRAQYMLKIEPLDGRNAAGFSAVAAHPAKPISIQVRLLDKAGFALCGKEIALRYDPAGAMGVGLSRSTQPADRKEAVERAALEESARERGKDTFRNIQGSDGAVEALWAQGELPCSADQYRRFDYWDLATNFPSVQEQEQTLGHGADESGAGAAMRGAAAKRKALAKKAGSTFSMEGDDRVTAYDASRGLLLAGPGRSFLIAGKGDQPIVSDWAADATLIHFKCDQHANCALRNAGGSKVIFGKMSN